MLYEELILNNLDCTTPVISNTKTRLTYSELHHKVLELAEILDDYNLGEGQRILIINYNSLYTVVTILTCIYLELCFIIVPKDSSENQIRYILEDARPVLMIDTGKVFGDGIVCTGLLNGDAMLTKLIYIIYTSGSTGKAKGVMAPEAQVVFCIHAINERLQNGPQDRILCCLPLSFDYGLYQLFFALAFRSVLILLENYIIQEIPQILFNEEITAFPAMPAMLSLLIYSGLLNKIKLPKLRYITSTGDYFPVALIRKIRNLLPQTEVIPMYGQTECKRVSVMPFGCEDKTMKGSCGLPLKGTAVWIENPDENGVGELIVSGPNVMEGYLHADAEAARYYFTHNEYGKCLRTGDLFTIDSDGYLYFHSRKRRVIKVNGYRIGPQELELAFRESLKAPYRELRIVGMPDRLTGEKIVLCIYSEEVHQNLIREVKHIAGELPKYQKPSKLYITNRKFPENTNGKIDDTQLVSEVMKHGTISL